MRTPTFSFRAPEARRSPEGVLLYDSAGGAAGQTSSLSEAKNQLLAHLPPEVLGRLAPSLQPVRLERQDVLFRAQAPLQVVYFPTTAVVSLVARLESGQALEVGVVGRDGVAGTALFPSNTTMTCDGVVLVSGAAQQISAEVLRRELLASAPLHSAIARFVQMLLVRSMQTSICNRFHSVKQRCIRSLLTVHDLSGHQDIPLTHETLATMLGVRRPTVTVVMGLLRRAGLVDEHRGHIVIRERSRLEDASCECYRVIRDEQRQVLGY